jgi:hypothetical protein
MATETNKNVRILRSGIYLFAILAMFLPMLLLAMSGAFAGESHWLYIDVVSGLCIVIVLLLVVGFAALLNGRKIPGWLLNAGPIAACFVVGSLPFGPYRENVGRTSVVCPALLLNAIAILIGFFSPRESPAGASSGS